MRYISHYQEYPIYEPAEGGYYYEGNMLVESKRLSKRKAKAELERIWIECQKENEEVLEYYNNDEEKCWGMLWIRNERNKNYIYRNYRPYDRNYYIGTGESYFIERKQGSQRSGRQPYC